MNMTTIPDDIFHEILLRLPVKLIIACRSVCKKFYSVISNPSFVNTHLNLAARNNFILTANPSSGEYTAHSIAYESLSNSADDAAGTFYKVGSFAPPCFSDLLCSCNGLVCLNLRVNEGFICLWNPATREYKELPQPPTSQNLIDPYLSALVYDYKINDYKFVIILLLDDERTCQILVYTLGSNSWKNIQNISCGRIERQSGVFLNGAFHWLGFQPEDCSEYLISFDISNETLNQIQLPKEASEESFLCVGVLEGSLCVVATHHFQLSLHGVTVWVMQQYGVRDSWSKRYIINHERILNCDLRLVWHFKNGEILFYIRGDDPVIYDPKNGCVREPNLHGLRNIIYEQGSYFETLVSLNSRTYVGNYGHVELSFSRCLRRGSKNTQKK